ncbi:VanZ-like protein [delta proteobacterium NaphS2]|nr:VanZ-like protein [delta proteobacterium NaphS2]
MTVIWLSLTPGLDLPCDFVNADKVYHMLAYLWLSALPFFAFSRSGGALTAALAMIFLGIGLEFVQAYVPGRSFSVADMAANSLGVILGIWLGRYMTRKHLLLAFRARAK